MLKLRASLNGELEAKCFWFGSRMVRVAGFGLQGLKRCYEVVFVLVANKSPVTKMSGKRNKADLTKLKNSFIISFLCC